MTKTIESPNMVGLDSGYIIKSPCRECLKRGRLPECSNDCEILAQVQELLAGNMSCSNNFFEFEEYALPRMTP